MFVGCAHVASGYNQGPTLLESGVDTLADLGCDTVRLWLSGNYQGAELPSRHDYTGQNWGASPLTLAELAATAPFQTVFSDPRVKRYMLGTWSFSNGIFDTWRGELTQQMIQNEYQEILNLCVYLLTNFTGKDFYIQTVESDWVLVNAHPDVGLYDPKNFIDPKMLDRCVAFYDVRRRAVEAARKAVPGATSRVFSCLEGNRVLDGQPRMHNSVNPRVEPDAVSWTPYEAIDDWTLPGATQESVEASIVTKTTEAIRRIRAAMIRAQGPRGAHIPIVVGELGWPEAHPLFAQPGGFNAAQFLQVFMSTCQSLGVAGVVFWQLWDNEVYTDPAPTHPQLRAIYDENGDTTLQGAAMINIFGGMP